LAIGWPGAKAVLVKIIDIGEFPAEAGRSGAKMQRRRIVQIIYGALVLAGGAVVAVAAHRQGGLTAALITAVAGLLVGYVFYTWRF
jgi:hypothetical protein